MLRGRRRGSKKAAQNRHAKRRAYERHGLVLRTQDLQKIVGLIRNGDSKLLGYQSLRVSGHQVTWEGKEIKVLYDNHRRTVITVLPEGAVWEGRRTQDETLQSYDAVGG